MLDFPEHLDLEVTNYCQCKCIMCPRHLMTRGTGFMEDDIFYKVIDECSGKVKKAYLHLIGDPLLHPAITEIINYTENAGIKTSMSTNCIALNKSLIDDILDTRLSEITLCLDGLCSDTYEKVREGAKFKSVMFNIESFLAQKVKLKSKVKVQMQMIKLHYNEREWNEFEKMWGWHDAVDEVLLKDCSSFAGAIRDFTGPENLRLKCNRLNTNITVHHNGDIVVCCRDYNGLSVMGNVRESSVRDIWHSDDYNYYRENFKESTLCRYC